MLREFIVENRDEIIRRAQARLIARRHWILEHWSPASSVSDRARDAASLVEHASYSDGTIAASAKTHGGNLTALGFTIRQVVHDYGDVCQAVTELALALSAPISVDEFHTLNRCLDTAIAEAVTEHARPTSEAQTTDQVRRTAHVAHDLRDSLQTAILSYNALKAGTIPITGMDRHRAGAQPVGPANHHRSKHC